MPSLLRILGCCLKVASYILLGFTFVILHTNQWFLAGRKLEGIDLGTLLEQLEAVAWNWESLGLALGMDPGVLDGLKGPHKPHKDCLKDMLKARMTTDLTVGDLIKAFSKGLTINLPMAKKLTAKYGTQMETPAGKQGNHPGPWMQYTCCVHVPFHSGQGEPTKPEGQPDGET